MKIVWTVQAVRDLVDPKAAAELAKRIVEATAKLAKHPELGRRGRLAGTRELIVAGTPFLIPYRIHQGRLELLRVLHGRRQYPPRD